MRIGVPTEIKPDEYRVAITPAGVRELSAGGHEVLVQAGAGEGSAISDEQFEAQVIVADAETLFGAAELVLKVKEPQPSEAAMLHADHVLFTYLHLAAEPELTHALQRSGATCIAYETVEDDRGRLPLLAPMSEVAGKIATQAGAFMLEKPLGGRGILLGGVPGVAAATVLVIGGGVVGMNAAFIAIGMEADVFVYDRNIDRLRQLDIIFGGRCSTCFASTLEIERRLPEADLIIGAVLIHGARAPRVIGTVHVRAQKCGSLDRDRIPWKRPRRYCAQPGTHEPRRVASVSAPGVAGAAHDYWLVPETFTPKDGANVPVRVWIDGDSGLGSERL